MALPAGLWPAVRLAWPSRPTTQKPHVRSTPIAERSDLFLTLTMKTTAAGEYQPLVVHDAEHAAAKVNPAMQSRSRGNSDARDGRRHLALVFCGQMFLPTLDPFGKVAEPGQAGRSNDKKLAEKKKETEIRKAKLKEKELDKALSPDVEKALAGLMTLAACDEERPAENNNEALIGNQKNLGEKFRATERSAERTLMSK